MIWENRKDAASINVVTMLLVMMLSGIFSSSYVQAAAIYYVSQDGSDSNPGTLSQPWKTIQKACNTVTAGSTVFVKAGSYNEKVTLNVSGSAIGYITIQNYENDRVIVSGTNKTGNSIFSISNKSYIRIKGLEICNSSTGDTPMGISIDGYGTGIELLNNKVYNVSSNQNAHGIGIYGTSGSIPIQNIVLDGNEVYNCKLGQSESIALNGNIDGFRVTNNKVHDNDNIGIVCIGFEDTAPANDQARNGVVSGNSVYNISSIGNPTYSDACADGIYVDGGKNITIEGNRVWNCDIGIEAASEHQGKYADNVLIRNNLVYNCRAVAGISFGGYAANRGFATNIHIINNTLYNNESNIMIQYNCQYSSNKIINNIIYSGTKISGSQTNIVTSNNISTNPSFKNASGGDFHLSSNSVAIDAGIAANYGTLDLDGNTRVTGDTVDCGAYEY